MLIEIPKEVEVKIIKEMADRDFPALMDIAREANHDGFWKYMTDGEGMAFILSMVETKSSSYHISIIKAAIEQSFSK